MSRAVSFSSYGAPEVHEVIDVPEVHPEEGQVRVAVRSAGLNPFDVKVRHGVLPKLVLPSGQGSEFAGVVIVGEGGAAGGDGPGATGGVVGVGSAGGGAAVVVDELPVGGAVEQGHGSDSQ